MTQINATHSLNMHSILEHGSNGLNGYFFSNTNATPHFAPLGQRFCVTKKV